MTGAPSTGGWIRVPFGPATGMRIRRVGTGTPVTGAPAAALALAMFQSLNCVQTRVLAIECPITLDTRIEGYSEITVWR